jgi:hypothetical protein
MTPEATEIEVEVLEIDGVAPAVLPARQDAPARGEWQDWRQWRGRVRRFDSRWGPLWVIPGIIVIALLLTVGLLLGVLWLLVRMCLKIVRAVLR